MSVSPESYLISAMQPGEALSTAAQIAVALADLVLACTTGREQF